MELQGWRRLQPALLGMHLLLQRTAPLDTRTPTLIPPTLTPSQGMGTRTRTPSQRQGQGLLGPHRQGTRPPTHLCSSQCLQLSARQQPVEHMVMATDMAALTVGDKSKPVALAQSVVMEVQGIGRRMWHPIQVWMGMLGEGAAREGTQALCGHRAHFSHQEETPFPVTRTNISLHHGIDGPFRLAFGKCPAAQSCGKIVRIFPVTAPFYEYQLSITTRQRGIEVQHCKNLEKCCLGTSTICEDESEDECSKWDRRLCRWICGRCCVSSRVILVCHTL